MSIKSVLDSVKHAAFEDDNVQPATSKREVGSHPARENPREVYPASAAAAPMMGTAIIGPGPEANAEIYQRLLEKTDLQSQPEVKELSIFLNSLEKSMPGDINKAMRLKVAAGQLEAIKSITPVQLLSVYDRLVAVLDTDNQDFTAALQKKQEDLAARRKQALDLQAQAQTMLSEAQADEIRLQAKSTTYQYGYQRRRTDLLSQQAEYSAILGVSK